MAFSAVAVTNPLYAGFSTPYRASFCVEASNTDAGDLYVNGQAGTAVGAVDLPTLFGSAYKSSMVQAILAKPVESTDEAVQLFGLEFDITITGYGVAVVAPGWIPLRIGSDNIPYIHLVAPPEVGVWRVTIQRRHSLNF